MSVNFEIKGLLAKLLATEDIIVENRNVDTACFNLETRVLTLPIWENASNDVYDLLLSHESSHAISTPTYDWTKDYDIPMQFVNVCEDVRVEKLIKRRYMGLPKTFYKGYKELYEQDFFEIADEDISTFNLADRVNLYFKIGNFIDVNFTEEEQELVSLIGDAETFDEVLIASQKLYEYCKKEKEQSKLEPFDNLESSGESSLSLEQMEQSESDSQESSQTQGPLNIDSSEKKTSLSQDSQPSENNSSQASSPSSPKNEEPQIKTADKLEERLRQLAKSDSAENLYLEVPKVNLNEIIVKNNEIYKQIEESFSYQQKRYNDSHKQPLNIFGVSDTEYKNFKTSAQKEVNYLVKEFECRKAADSYSRALTSRTGVLDCSRLHSYKFSDDIFKKITVLPEGKNHGLIFILDWSGSMGNVILDTLKQLYNLIWFCKKVSIPFEVYAFTCEWNTVSYDYEKSQYVAVNRNPSYVKKPGLLSVYEGFSLMNILSHKTSSRDLENQMKYIWRLAMFFRNPYGFLYSCPSKLNLSGTPLNETLITLHQLIPHFQSENKLQKAHCIILTDGEADPPPYHVEIRKKNKESYIGTNRVSYHKSFLRDRSLGTTYKAKPGFLFSDTLLTNLKDKFPSVSFIGIRLLGGRDMSRFLGLYHYSEDSEYKKLQNQWKKDNSVTIKSSGYDAYFGISSHSLSQESEFIVEENATKSQIKSAFVKSLKVKKLNKRILGEFVSLIV